MRSHLAVIKGVFRKMSTSLYLNWNFMKQRRINVDGSYTVCQYIGPSTRTRVAP
jgi:hypothetical protein